MSDETPAPSCAKCGTPGVPSYIVLSPFMQYWRCPDCFCVWTTLKASAVHTRPFENPVGSARTHCPQCGASDTTDLDGRLHSERVDYFRCRVCDCWWMVPKGQDGPATRIVFDKPGTSVNPQKGLTVIDLLRRVTCEPVCALDNDRAHPIRFKAVRSAAVAAACLRVTTAAGRPSVLY